MDKIIKKLMEKISGSLTFKKDGNENKLSSEEVIEMENIYGAHK